MSQSTNLNLDLEKQSEIKGGIRELEHLLAHHQTKYGSSERPFLVVESDDIRARIDVLNRQLRQTSNQKIK